ncbi:MAG TPA: nucleotidyltransferase domain-containing protein [Longimicrobium sp.]|jgi:predicted nucleotidyltransferase|nr:nucleotidyltransferase domain-containing protein [Longimicrobium sp.]
MLFAALEGVLGSTSKIQLLRALLPLNGPVSGREAQRLARVSSDNGSRQALNTLTELGLLTQQRLRGSHLYTVNRDHHLVAPLEALFAAESQRLRMLRDTLRGGLESKGLLPHVASAILFGSAARGDARPDSDLDVLFVADTKESVDAVEDAAIDLQDEVFARLGVTLAPITLPLARFRERYAAGDPLLHNVEADGRTLIGSSVAELVKTR